jgi:tetratricopeptide (TPR) repeat protein
VYYAEGHAELAFVNLNAAIRIKHDNPVFYRNRGRIFLDFGNERKALKDFEYALALDPGDQILQNLISETRKMDPESMQR